MREIGAAGIGGGVGEFGGELGLLRFEVGDLLLALRDLGLELTDIRGGGLDRGLGLFGLRGFDLLRSGIGEAGGQRGAFVAGLGFLEIVGVVARILRQAAGVHVEDRLGDLADEVHVVADEVERAFVGLQGGDERVDRHDVEVRRRLVHEQEVRRVDQQLHQRETGFLAAGKHRDLLMDVVLAEEERAEHAAGLLFGEAVLRGAELHHVLEDGQLRVEVVDAVLGEVARDHVAAFLAEAAVDRDDAGEDLEEGGLAGAVGADEHRTLAAFALEVEVLVDDVFTVGLLYVLELHHLEAGAGRLGEAELDLLQVVFGLIDRDLFEAGDLLLLGLRAGSHRSLGAEAVDERLQVRDLALLVLEHRLLAVFAGHALEDEVVVVAVVAMEALAAEFDHARAEGVEEGTVVRDDDEAARIAGQVLLEPEQRLEVEVIGRFVEEEERRLADEQAGEVRAHDPAAGECLGELVVVAFAEAEAGEDLLRARFEGVVDVPVVIVLGLELAAARGDLEDRLIADGGAFLREEAEVRAAFPLDEAVVRLVLIEDDVEEGGLAGAVGADEAEAVRPGDVQRDLREQGAGSVGLGNIGNREHRKGVKEAGGRKGKRKGGGRARGRARSG